MKLFACPNCENRIYFENGVCLFCETHVLFDPKILQFVKADDAFTCTNAVENGCNWTSDVEGGLCLACSLNRTIPDLSIEGNRGRWMRVEAAKRRSVYSLLFHGLDVAPKPSPDDEIGLAFDFLADEDDGESVVTGHDNGLITLNVAEADSVERERMRISLGEDYRTLLGHFRHELGHYYWDRLIRDDREWLDRFSILFGDHSEDYGAALKRHYRRKKGSDWQKRYISAYAASHAWEDWAESWAHYLHIYDTLEMVAALNMPLGRLDSGIEHDLPPNEANYTDHPPHLHPADSPMPPEDFDELLTRWLILCEASNSINRCMGLPDLYPFVISETVAEKLRFVHELLQMTRRIARQGA